ncbi:hypothetical protein [Desulforamulus reducens]|uniref:hypothetical protein n=1 Tax=Desulforamulus reducens TaxID=59610 RepID=UPI00059EBB1C|nr:hypothetical protein [Desulforamulus reducens]
MSLVNLRDLLLTVTPNVYHYHAHKKHDSYIVWSEYGTQGLNADSEIQEISWRVQVDFFTKTEFDPNVEKISSLLDREDISFSYLVDYEQDTGYVHHIWDCEVA